MPHISAQELLTLRQIRSRSLDLMTPLAKKWLCAGAESGHTVNKNEAAFREVQLLPRMFNDVSSVNLNSKFLSDRFPAPIFIAPLGHLTQFHTDGELCVAKAAEITNTPAFISMYTRISWDEIRDHAPNAPLGMQLLMHGDRDWMLEQLDRAKKYSCSYICITGDNPVTPILYDKVDTGYDARLYGRSTSKITADPALGASVTWDDIDYICTHSSVPIIIKGILHPHDVDKAREAGVASIWVSNHGGRTLESDLSPLSVLPILSTRWEKKNSLIFDGGITCGSDCIKALSLGAEIVSIGRLVVQGLTIDGTTGICRVIELLTQEIETSMAMLGLDSISSLGSCNLFPLSPSENN
jgi:4-hydroxymandelate oxidase